MTEPAAPINRQDNQGPVVLEAKDARQGALGRPVLYVLVSALVLAMIVWAAVEYYGKSIDTETPQDSQKISEPTS